MSTPQLWWSQFANDPNRDFEVYLELLEGDDARGQIVRGSDGELYLTLLGCPEVRVPLRWLTSAVEKAASLPLPDARVDS